MKPLACLLVVPFAAALAAQDPPTKPAPTAPTTAAAAPAAIVPQIVVDTIGPDGWRVRFGPTNLGGMLESEKGREIWQPRVAPFLGGWQQLSGVDEQQFPAVRARWLGYGGRIKLAFHFESRHDRQANHVAVVLDGDGRTDLDAMANDLKELQYRAMPGEWQEQEIGGSKVTVRGTGDLMTAPIREGNHLLLAMATAEDLEPALRMAHELAADCAGKVPAPTTPALRMQFDLPAFVAMAMGSGPDSERAWMEALGMSCLGPLTFTVGTAGPHVQLEVAEQFARDERGLFAALFPAVAKLPGLLAAQPGQDTAWKVGHFDAMAAWQAIERAILAAEQVTAEKLHEDMMKELGIDLGKDLLPWLDGEVMLVGALPGHDVDRATFGLVMRLRDEAAFGKSFYAMLQKTKGVTQRKESGKHGDIPIHRYGSFLTGDMWVAVGNGAFVLTAGNDAEEQIGTLLDACKRLPQDTAVATAPPQTFDALKRHLPAGLNGLGFGKLDSVMMLPPDLWWSLVREFTPIPFGGEPTVTAEDQEQAMALLRENHLDVVRSASGFAERTWRWRLYW